MMEPFAYYSPGTISEAVQLLGQHAAKPLMGGTDLIVQMQEKVIAPQALVDLTGIPALGLFLESEGQIHIGSAVTHARIVEWAALKAPYLALAEAAYSVGTPQVRNIGTLTGNLCNAVPSADLAAPVLVLGGVLTIAGQAGERRVRAQDFFTGPKKTVLQKDEIVTKVSLEAQPQRTASCYLKMGPRRASDLATVGVAALLSLDEAGKVRCLRIGLGAVAPTPILAGGLDSLLGMRFGPDVVAACAQAAKTACRPITDIRASAAYRRQMVGVLTKRALTECAERIEGGN